jgi:hypothetical protein
MYISDTAEFSSYFKENITLLQHKVFKEIIPVYSKNHTKQTNTKRKVA